MTYTFDLVGLEASAVRVSATVADGAKFTIDGKNGDDDVSVREIRTRVRSVLGLVGSFAGKSVAVSFDRPVDLRGGRHDLAVAVAILEAALVVPHVGAIGFIGELALTGTVRPSRGVLPCLLSADAKKLEHVVVSRECSRAETEGQPNALVTECLSGVVDWLKNRLDAPAQPGRKSEQEQKADAAESRDRLHAEFLSVAEHIGAECLILVGKPGCGKTIAAQLLSRAQASLTDDEQRELSCIYSVAGILRDRIEHRPFRAPHHTCSTAALVGGGSPCRPGEVTLAHNGLLFLDEAHEFRKESLLAVASAIQTKRTASYKGNLFVSYPAKPRQLILTVDEAADEKRSGRPVAELREIFEFLRPVVVEMEARELSRMMEVNRG